MPPSRLPEPSLVCEQILDCMGTIASGIAQSQSLDTILHTAVEEGRKILQTDRVLIYRFQAEGSGVVVVESVGSNWTSILNSTLDDSCFANFWAEAYNQGDFRAIEDIDTPDIQPCDLEFLAQFQVRANLVVPILQNQGMPQANSQKPLWGLLMAHHCSSDRSWQPLEVKLLQHIAMQVAIGFATAQRAIAIGQTQAIDALHTAVTQRQEAQAKRQTSEEFLHSIYEGAANSIFVVDVLPSGEFRFAGLNPAHERLTGLRREDIEGKSPEQVLPPMAAAAVSANYVRCVQAGTTISYEESLPFQGKETWWLTTLTPLRDAQSRIYQLTGTSINITDRKQAEKKLTRQKEFLRNVIDTNPNLIGVKDWEGRFRLVNQALANIYCTTVEDLTGKTDTHFNSNPAEVEHYLHDDRQVMSSLQSKFIPEEILTSPTGKVHYLQTIKKPLLSPDGRMRYVIFTSTDITARKRAEQERDREVAAKHRLFEHIEQQNQTLEAKVQERTAQLSLTNQQLRQEITERKQAKKVIQASLLEKETLLKEIHHRVKNNLQIISSLLRLQSRQIKDHGTLELFKESQNRVQAMALIHEKLYQSSNLAQIDFQQYITTLVDHLCRSYDIHQPGIMIKINVEPVPLPIDTAIPCGLIINELVSNALKYAFSGNPVGEICVNLQFGASSLNAPIDTERFILTINDNGVGLPEDLDFRNTSSLGLQLVCRLAKQIGGSLELNRSQGTEFNLAFASSRSQ